MERINVIVTLTTLPVIYIDVFAAVTTIRMKNAKVIARKAFMCLEEMPVLPPPYCFNNRAYIFIYICSG